MAMTVEILKAEAGRRLDAMVTRAVFGGPTGEPQPYSTDPVAALGLRKRMHELGWDSQDMLGDQKGNPDAYTFRFSRWWDNDGNFVPDPPLYFQVVVDSIDDAPLAICRAALAAVGDIAPAHVVDR